MTIRYAGIGSRKTPADVLLLMENIGRDLAGKGMTLRSGGAKGADSAFERGCDQAGGDKEIFLSGDAEAWAFEEAREHVPEDRPDFDGWKPYVRGLIARNMMQVLGRDGDEPVAIVICWTPADIKDGGGTGYAMRCAASRGIPIHNLMDEGATERLKDALRKLLKEKE
jgi:hypothetical protein